MFYRFGAKYVMIFDPKFIDMIHVQHYGCYIDLYIESNVNLDKKKHDFWMGFRNLCIYLISFCRCSLNFDELRRSLVDVRRISLNYVNVLSMLVEFL